VAEFDNEEAGTEVMLSANLCAVAGVEERDVHEGEVDEGKVMWEAPTFSGLGNSTTVDTGSHWYAERTTPPAAAPEAAAAFPTGLVAALPVSGLPQPTGQFNFGNFSLAGGGIDWGALSSMSGPPQ